MRKHFGIWVFSMAISLYSIIGFSQVGGMFGSEDKEIDFLKSTSKPTLIIFSANWCPPCRAAKKFLEKPENKILLKKFKVEKYDFDVDKNMKKKYNITKVPTFILIDKNHEIQQRSIGISNNFSSLKKMLNFRN